jgi:cysteine-rich repeat protein
MGQRGRRVRTAALAAVAACALACGLDSGGIAPSDGGDAPPVDGGDGDAPRSDDGDVPRPDDAGGDAEAEASPVCGNELLESGEECDDGAANSDTVPDACRTDCRRAHCGDAVVDTGEACDDGNTSETDGCLNDCRAPGCGDGIVQGAEECDDGNADDTDACLHTCRNATCGDGYVWAGRETCDGPAAACTTGCGTAGRRSCVACVLGSCAAVELCNALDDDCDTATDEDFACIQGTTTGCTTACTTFGTGICSPACAAPAGIDCAGPSETCDGTDEDCDGAIDEDFECVLSTGGACTNACGAAGTRACLAGSCAWSPCCGTVEVCPTDCASPSCDDDCDGTTDEGCPPCNDTCAAAQTLTGSGTVTGTTAGATSDHSGACGAGATAPDVWFTFTLATRELVYLDTRDGQTWDSTIAVYSGACPGAAVGCNDDSGCGGTMRSTWTGVLDPGTYQVVVDGWGTAFGAFTLAWQHIPVGGTPTPITGNGDLNTNTTGQGNDHSGSCGGSTAPDVDYYVLRCTARDGVTAHTCHGAGETDIDTVLYWLGPNGVERVCNDDDATCGGGATRSRLPGTRLEPGITVLVVDGKGTAAGLVRTTIGGM